MIRLSIVMPIYNGQCYINNTIGHILAYDIKNIQLVLVDDGSQDDSWAICESFAKRDSRVVCVKKENGGIADARNLGVNKAQGEYLAFVDQDDYIDVKEIVSCLDANESYDMILFSTNRKYEDSTTSCDTVLKNMQIESKKEIFERLIWPMVSPTSVNKVVSYIGHVWAGVYKRSLLEKNHIRFNKFVSIEDDFLFVFDALNYSANVATINRIGYYWSTNRKSLTYNPKYIDEFAEKCTKFYDYIESVLESKEMFDADKKRKYHEFRIQLCAVRIVINEGILTNDKTMKESVELLREYIDKMGGGNKFKRPYLGKGISRRSAYVVYWFISMRMYWLAILFAKGANIVNCIRARGNIR